jgi:F0F1-type ATP synthase assembly protein I
VESRVTRLEAAFEHIQSDVTEMKADLKALAANTAKLPTRAELTANFWQISLVSASVAAIVIGAIIGGLGWLETRDARIQSPPPSVPQPIVIQLAPAPTQAKR